MRHTSTWLASALLFVCLALGYRFLVERANLSTANALLKKQENSTPNRIPVQISSIIKANPEYTALYTKQIRRKMNALYCLSTLNLTPEKLNRLKDLLAERQMALVLAAQTARRAGLTPNSDDFDDALEAANKIDKQQIAEILGPRSDSKLAELRARGEIENEILAFSSDFSDAGVPLTPDQTKRLVQVALAAFYWPGKDKSSRPPNYNAVDPKTGLSLHDERILNNATQVLTAAQLEVLKTVVIETERNYTIMGQYENVVGPGVFAPPFHF